MDQIIVVSCSEDGDVMMEVMTEGEFLDRLDARHYGEKPNFRPGGAMVHDLAAIEGMYVIKGRFVMPKAVDVAVKYELE